MVDSRTIPGCRRQELHGRKKGTEIYKPAGLHNFSLYLDGKWYSLTAKPGTYNDNDPIGVLDVTIRPT